MLVCRKVVWKHILNVYPDGMTGKERMDYIKKKANEYYALRAEWKDCIQKGKVMKIKDNMYARIYFQYLKLGKVERSRSSLPSSTMFHHKCDYIFISSLSYGGRIQSASLCSTSQYFKY